MDSQKSFEKLKKILNSLLISAKDGVSANKLNEDYYETEGTSIPFQEYGFNNLIEFMASLTDIAYCTRNNEGKMVYMGKANESNAHIQRMIRAQKPKKKKSKGLSLRRPSRLTRPFHSPFPQRIQSSRGGYRPPMVPAASRRPAWYQPRGRSGYAVPNTPYQSFKPTVGGKPYANFQVNRTVVRAAEDSAAASRAQRTYSENRFALGYEVPPRFRERNMPPSQAKVLVPKTVPISSKGKSEPAFAPVSMQDGKQYKDMLHTYMSRNKLGTLEYATTPWNNNGFVSYVTIKGEVYGSLLNYKSKQEAEQAAAKHALEKLGILAVCDAPSVYTASSLSSESGRTSPENIVVPNEALMKQRVKALLEKRPNGLWHTRLPVEYRENYNEEMPPEVMEVLERWDIVKVEGVANTDRKILYPVKEEERVSLIIPDVVLPEPGSRFTAYLCHVWDPGEFFIQRADSPLEDIQNMLTDTCEKKKPPCVQDPEIGSYCISQYEGAWYRARIIGSDVSDSGSPVQYDIYYCDYGNLETKPSEQILQITGPLCKEPAQAIKCTLHDTYPTKTRCWSDEAKAYFNEMNEEMATLAIEVIEKFDDCVSVEVKKADNNTSIRDDMIDKGLALATALPTVEEFVEPPPLDFPYSNQWDVYVSYINQSCDIIVRLVDDEYSEKLDELQEEMKQKCTEPVLEPEINRVYAQAPDPSDPDEWIRARVNSLEAPDKVNVAYVDHGGEETISVSSLRHLPNSLNTLPYQKVKCSLDGLELQQKNEKIYQNLLDMVLGNTYVAVIKDRSDKISLTLWDTSNEKEEVNINEKIGACLEDEELTPALPKVGRTIEGIVTHIEEDFFYFIIDGPGLQRLEKLNQEISAYYSQPNSAVHFVSNPLIGTLVVCKDVDGSWYRARIENTLPNRKVEVFYVDYGKQEIVSSNSLRFTLPSIRLLASLPHQAVKCKLFNLPPENGSWTEQALTRMEELIIDKKLVLEVVTNATESHPAEVELYFWENDEMVGVSEVLLAEKVFGDVPIACPPGTEKLVLQAPQSPQQEDAPSSSSQPSPFQTPAESPSPVQSEHSLPSLYGEVQVPSHLEHQEPPASELNSKSPDLTQVTLSSAPQQRQSVLPSVSPSASPSRPSHVNPLDAPLPDSSVDSSEISEVPPIADDDPDALVKEVAERIQESLQLQQQFINSNQGAACISPRLRDHGDSISPERASNDSGIEVCRQGESQQPPELPIPGPEQYLDIHVIWVVHPSNFRCTPYETRYELEKMEAAMNAYYENENIEPPSEFYQGQLLACRNNNSWHRVSVNSTLPGAPGQVNVNFVDQGIYNSAEQTDLRPLASQFRNLPFQAIKASLADVSPVSAAGWTQAAIDRFRELTLNRDLVALIRERLDPIVVVELFDTSAAQDMNIGLELQRNGYATIPDDLE